MNQSTWAAVDTYFDGMLTGEDDVLRAAVRACDQAGLPRIQVTPNQGAMLHLLARARGARRVLEIGTLGAYSTIWLARALPASGRVITLERDPTHAAVARANLARAGLADRVQVIEGAALNTLPGVAGPFDLFFIDADKGSNALYFEWALRLASPGAVIVIDNVVRGGAVVEAGSDDESVRGVRRLVESIARTPGIASAALQTVGSKGYDGFILAMVAGREA